MGSLSRWTADLQRRAVVEGVFWSPDVRRILVDGSWLTEGNSYGPMTVLTIEPDQITVQRGDQIVSITPPEPEIEIYRPYQVDTYVSF